MSEISNINVWEESSAQQYRLQGESVQAWSLVMQFLQPWFPPQIHLSS